MNTIRLDGYGTFLGKGIISMMTPAAKHSLAIPRVKVTSDDIANLAEFPLNTLPRKRQITSIAV